MTPITPPEVGAGVGWAGIGAAIGMGLLKLGEALLRHSDRRHLAKLEDIDTSFAAGSKIRAELRSLADTYHRRAVSAEAEAERLHGLMIEMQRTLDNEKKLSDARLHELRDLKIRHGIPVIPPEPEPRKEP